MDGEIDTLKGILNKQNMEMEFLRRQVSDNKGVHNTYITSAAPAPASVTSSSGSHPVKIDVPSEPSTIPHIAPSSASAPTHTPVATAAPIVAPIPVPVPATAPTVSVTEPIKIPEKKNKVLFSEEGDVVPVQMHAPAAAASYHEPAPKIVKPTEVVKEEKIIEKEVLDDGCVDIIFPFSHNPDLDPGSSNVNLSQSQKVQMKTITNGPEAEPGTDSMCVRLLKDITTDDLVFELRHFIATEVRSAIQSISPYFSIVSWDVYLFKLLFSIGLIYLLRMSQLFNSLSRKSMSYLLFLYLVSGQY